MTFQKTSRNRPSPPPRRVAARRWGWAAALGLLVQTAAQAQFVPGTDPVVLNSAVSVEMMPLAESKSKGLEGSGEMPSWLNAKVVRYEAKAGSADRGSISTDTDVNSYTSIQNGRRTCVQEVGSNTVAAGAGGRYGPGRGGDQIVVLRGDLINVC